MTRTVVENFSSNTRRLFQDFTLSDLLLVFILGALALFFIFQSVRLFFRYWQVARTPRLPIDSSPLGYVEISGQAQPWEGQSIRTPFTRENCVWFRFLIEERPLLSNAWKRHGRWVPKEKGDSGNSFWLEDTSGRCLIQPAGATFNGLHKKVWSGDEPRPSQGPQATPRGSGTFRYTEEWIETSDVLFARGWFETLHVAAAIENELRDALRAIKESPEALLRAYGLVVEDLIKPEVWDLVRERELQKIKMKRADQGELKGTHTLSIPAEEHLPFVVSWVSPVKSARVYLRRAALALGAAALCAGFPAFFALRWISRSRVMN